MSRLSSKSSTARRTAFTLIEMLVVVAIILILASMLLPVLDQARNSGYRVACMNNLKQLQLGHTMYTADNDKYYMHPYSSGDGNNNHWVGLDDDRASIELGQMINYVSSTDSYYCEADEIHLWRSYSINNAIGGTVNHAGTTAVLKRNKVTESPSQVYSIIEESDPRGTNQNSFYVNSGTYASWSGGDWPAVYHINSYNTAYLDGHVKNVQMSQESITISLANTTGLSILATNPDRQQLYEWQNVVD